MEETSLMQNISSELLIKIAILIIVVLIAVKLLNMAENMINSKIGMSDQSRIKTLMKGLRAILIALIALTCMSTLGINTSNILTLLAAFLMAIVVALRDYLANMAGGVMILTLKPYVVGDYIICSAGEGVVKNIMLSRTDIVTIDKRIICIPNGTMASTAVTNTSTDPFRRLDIEVDVAYGTDIAHAKEVLERIYREDPEILADKGVFAHVNETGASGVTMRVEGYVVNARYWEIRWRLLEKVLKELPEEGIEIPYNKLDVYMKESFK